MENADSNIRLIFCKPADCCWNTLPLRSGSIKKCILSIFCVFYDFNYSGRSKFLFSECDPVSLFPLRILKLPGAQH